MLSESIDSKFGKGTSPSCHCSAQAMDTWSHMVIAKNFSELELELVKIDTKLDKNSSGVN